MLDLLLGYFSESEKELAFYNKLNAINLYGFTEADETLIKHKDNFFLGKYELKNVDYFIVYVDVSYLNSKVLAGDILIDLPDNVRVPIVIAVDKGD